MNIGYFDIEKGLVITHCYKCGELLKECTCDKPAEGYGQEPDGWFADDSDNSGHECRYWPQTCMCDERDFAEEEYNRNYRDE